MNDSTVLLDTNILVYAHDTLSPHNSVAQRILKRAWKENIQACIALQNIAEFFAIITDTKRSPSPLPFNVAYKIIDEYIQAEAIQKIIENELTPKFLLYLIKEHRPRRQEVHDVRLVALMLSWGVKKIYTADEGFKKFKEIEAINPFK